MNVQHRIKKRMLNIEDLIFFSFPCSSVGMHTIWVPTLEHGNQVEFGVIR